MKGLGCDAAAVSGLLCRRSNDQRQAVRSAYGRLFGRELLKDLSKELRGHHEDPDMASHFGFKAEVDRRLGISNAWELFKPVMEALPVAAVMGRPPRRILALHGGISPRATLADIARIQRPSALPRHGLLTDLLWADFDPLTDHYAQSHRGISHKFGQRALKRFCRLNDLALLIRSHQLVQQGFQFAGPRLLTLWTATCYNNEFTNAGAICDIDKDFRLTMKVLMREADEDAEEELVSRQAPAPPDTAVPAVVAVPVPPADANATKAPQRSGRSNASRTTGTTMDTQSTGDSGATQTTGTGGGQSVSFVASDQTAPSRPSRLSSASTAASSRP